MPPQSIPVTLPAQVGLYRRLVAGKRVLVLIDNARDADQVRPLLPNSAGCLALVTNRHMLPALVVTDGAHPMTLDLLTVAESRQLLAAASARTGSPLAAERPVLLAVVGDRVGEAVAWKGCGLAHAESGDTQAALDCYERALSLRRENGERLLVADILLRMGDTHAAASHVERVEAKLSSAVRLRGGTV